MHHKKYINRTLLLTVNRSTPHQINSLVYTITMKLCAACHQDLPKDKFSKKQWKLGAECQRRCTTCVRDNREVQQPPPPVHENNDNGIVSSLESMSINDYKMIPPSDEDLFKQPPKPEDCPICFLMMPSLHTGHKYNACCGKVICGGCVYANAKIDPKKQLCPFCRTPISTLQEKTMKRLEKRLKLNDARAHHELAVAYSLGSTELNYFGLFFDFPQDMDKALELWHRAGELGCAYAYHNIGCKYMIGEGVERDVKTGEHYWKLAAMGGDDIARNNLGILEKKDENMDRALKHFMISAGIGYTDSLKHIHELFTRGYVTKDDYMKALQLYQTYLGEIRSDQRDKAAAVHEEFKYY